MEDLGAPASYMTLEEGTAVYSRDGESIGKVTHVLAEPDLDLFDGIVIDHSALPGGHHFCDADQVEEIFERGVVLKLSAAESQSLPKPSANPGEIEVGADDMVPDELHDKLRRAWDRISGKR